MNVSWSELDCADETPRSCRACDARSLLDAGRRGGGAYPDWGVAGLTGEYKQPALMHQRAYLLCQDLINARGGILNRTVSFLIRDDHSGADMARDIYRSFTDKGGVDIVLAPYSSDLTAAVAPIADERGFPMLGSRSSCRFSMAAGLSQPDRRADPRQPLHAGHDATGRRSRVRHGRPGTRQ